MAKKKKVKRHLLFSETGFEIRDLGWKKIRCGIDITDPQN
jgi:hypothetical protein